MTGVLLGLLLLGDGVERQVPLLERAGMADTVRRELLSRAAPGAVVALVHGDVIEVEAVGHVDPARTTPMTADRLFGTGELSQMVAGLVAARMAEAGEVALDAPIRRWAPDLPPRVGELTLAQLLTNTSGLDDAQDEPPRRGPGPTVWPGATDRALFTEPAALYSPSRHAPRLARALLVSAAGVVTFDALARALLFEPAGMERTTFDGAVAELLGAVAGQVVSLRADAPLYALLPRASPIEQMYATAGDLGALLRAGMAEEGPLRGALAWVGSARAVRPADARDSIGAGVRITRFAGRRMVAYEGGIGGYGTAVRWLPEERVGVVALANATGAVLTRTADGLLRHALGVEGPGSGTTEPAPVPDAPVADSAYAGTWANGDRIILIEHADGALYWRDGDLRLEIRREGGRLDVLVGDGRTAQTLFWFADNAGAEYLLAGDLAYRRRAARFRR